MCDFTTEVAEMRRYAQECREQFVSEGTTEGCPYERGSFAWSAWQAESRIIAREQDRSGLSAIY
jgi:hypothetical protein